MKFSAIALIMTLPLFACAGGATDSGSSCNLTTNDDGTATLKCGDDSEFVIGSGATGDEGPAGAPGAPCTLTDNGDATATLECPGADPVTVTLAPDGATSQTLNGSVTIANETDLAAVAPYANITGDVWIGALGLETVDLPNLQTLGGDLIVSGESLQSFSASNLVSVGGAVSFSDNPALESITLTGLTEIARNFTITGNEKLGDLSFDTLATVGGPLSIYMNNGLGTVTMTSLVALATGGWGSDVISYTENELAEGATSSDFFSLRIANNGDLSYFDARSLLSLKGSVWVEGNTSLGGINLNDLSDIDGAVRIVDNAGLGSVDLPGLKTVSGDVSIDDNPILLTCDFTMLSTVSGNIHLHDNATLQALSMDNLGSCGGISLYKSGAVELTAASLTEVVGNIYLSSNSKLSSFDLSSLAACENLTINDNTFLAAADLPKVATVDGKLKIENNGSLETLHMNSLTEVIQTFRVVNNSLLPTCFVDLIVEQTTIGQTKTVTGNRDGCTCEVMDAETVANCD